MAPFVSTEELGVFLGEELAGARLAQAELALGLASGQIQGWTRQTLDMVEDDTITVIGPVDWELELPERPVVDVSAVTVNGVDIAPDLYRLDGHIIVRVGGWWWDGPGDIEITYSHGYDPIPDDIRAVTLQLAARGMTNPQGISQEAIGTYSVTYSGVAGDRDPLLATLSRYRIRAASLPMRRNPAPTYPVANG